MAHWVYFLVLTIVMYVCIALIGRFTGGAGDSALDSIRQLLKPTVLGLILVANVLFAVALYYGFLVSANALSLAIAIGLVTSFVYATVTLGVAVTATKLIGVAFVLLGIYLMR